MVLDNASTDETREICDAYRDPRFRYEYEGAPGQSIAWNRSVELARGRHVILLHADDELDPRFLRRTVEILRSNDDVGLVHCTVRHIDESGAPLPIELQRLFGSDVVDRDDAALRRLLLEGCVINPAGVLVRREAYDSVGPFTDRVLWGVDWHMWTRIAMTWGVGYVDEPLARYRHHTTSGTSGVLTSARNGRDELWALDDLFRIAAERRPDLLRLRTEARHGVANRTWWLAERMCQEGEMRAARRGLRNAIRLWPALIMKGRTWALIAATFLGYDWFERIRKRTQRNQSRRQLPS